MRTRTKIGVIISLVIILGAILGSLRSDDAFRVNGSLDFLMVYPGQVLQYRVGDIDLAYMFEGSDLNVTINMAISNSGTYTGSFAYLGSVELGKGETFLIGETFYTYEGSTGHFFLFKKVPLNPD